MVDLRGRHGLAARALELTILTAARTSEVLEARWSEFDLERAVWTVPAARIKAGKEHRIPLALSEKNPEGVRFFAAIAFSETWDAAGIDLMRTVLKKMHNTVLKYAVLQKMLNDYRLERYRLANADAFRNLIAETEIEVLGTPKTQKGARVIALKNAEES